MKQKHVFIILGTAGIIFLLFWCAAITLVVKNFRGSNEGVATPVVVDVALCDEDASGLCIVTFGANNLNRMVIHFQLPDADYVPFYVKATNRGTVSVYTCEVEKVEVVETEVAGTETVGTEAAGTETVGTEAAGTEVAGTQAVETEIVEIPPTSIYCTGVRTPLGETIDLEVYTTDGDQLIARGTFLVSAIALPTPINVPSETPTEEIPTEPPATATDLPFIEETPTLDLFSTPNP
jgi:hypothetical protein